MPDDVFGHEERTTRGKPAHGRPGPATSRRDDEIERDLIDTLVGDARLDIANLNVQVQDGTLRLRGTVSNLFQHHLAERVTGRIKGVRNLVNELSIAPTAVRSDDDITSDVVGTLLRDPWIDGHLLQVRVERGVVLLQGSVDSYYERVSAEDDVRTVRGVKRIENLIEVAPGPIRHDEELAGDIRLALLRNLRFGRSEIDVSARDGVVRLRGSVSSVESRRAIEEIAKHTPGVKSVINEVRVVT